MIPFLHYLTFKKTPKVSPIDPPKLKMEKVPKLSIPIFPMICRFISYPMVPKIVARRHSNAPDLPITAENATMIAKAHFIAPVIQFPLN